MKRYMVVAEDGTYADACVEERKDGDWVRWEDVRHLVEKRSTKKSLENIQFDCIHCKSSTGLFYECINKKSSRHGTLSLFNRCFMCEEYDDGK